MHSVPDIPPVGVPPDSQPFACLRCWKQKKKCDKLIPKCSRCARSKASCVYSTSAPTERTGVHVSQQSPTIENSLLYATIRTPLSTSQVILEITYALQRLQSKSIAEEWQQQFMQPPSSLLGTILVSIRDNIHETCELYLGTMNVWLPLVVEAQFRDQLVKFQTQPEPEVTLLVLSMYLLVHIPVQIDDDSTDTSLLYATLKSLYINLMASTEPSILLIQAGLLIAVYEYGQGFDQKSYQSIGICARMGHLLGLHKTLSRGPPIDIESRAVLETHRHVWWSVVIIERVLSVPIVDPERPFGTRDPSLYDLLPSFRGRDAEMALQLGRESESLFDSKSMNSAPKLEFPKANSFARSAQATYLLSRVFNHVKGDLLPEARQAEVIYLDTALQAFTASVSEQANREMDLGLGHSCGAYLIAIKALLALHLHNHSFERRTHSPAEAHGVKPPLGFSFLALQSLVRIGVEVVQTKLNDPVVGARSVPPYYPYMLQNMFEDTRMLLESTGNEMDEAKRLEDLDALMRYLTVARSKWGIAGKHLEAIKNHPNYPQKNR
ncbi:fungal specific transcription factor [Phlyctema vagabunda]|uniref:Fungal specific transcription factor n=1 Tax=Phlyctema vagabunda TaxID=108571 RepID=A0ABR4P9Q2_9HELO